MRSPKEIIFLVEDYCRYMSGADYFRKRQGLGAYFEDPRCYYNDLRHKADWGGVCVDGVPALRMVQSGETSVLPVMVLLYGLGSADRYFLENDATRLDAVGRVSGWLIQNMLPEGYFDNGCSQRHPTVEYVSDNSAMSQGLALSFATRAILYKLVGDEQLVQLRCMVDAIIANMLRPLSELGTAVYRDNDLFLLEDCTKDGSVVLNGWIFGVFGLFDYLRLSKQERVESCLSATIDTMKRVLPDYCLTSGWSYYDDRGRISSPFYHDLHISMLEAMHRLTGAAEFAACCDRFRRANTRFNRTRYTINKIKDRLLDKNALGS